MTRAAAAGVRSFAPPSRGAGLDGCCYPDEYGEQFSERRAQRDARRYLRSGLRGTSRKLADAVLATGSSIEDVLEVGGGVGEIQAHLLRHGVERCTNVDLSPNWERAAAGLLGELGLDRRVDRRVGDFVTEAVDLPTVDAVILHRVVCCYPDWAAMVAAATSRTRGVLAMTLPADRWWNRAIVAAGNRFLSWREREFRAFVHPPGAVAGAVEAAGFRRASDHTGVVWRTMVFVRHTTG